MITAGKYSHDYSWEAGMTIKSSTSSMTFEGFEIDHSLHKDESRVGYRDLID